jgi:hypothetical protein
MDTPLLTDEQLMQLLRDVCADPARKDVYGPFFYRALLENLIASRRVNNDLMRRVNLLTGISN